VLLLLLVVVVFAAFLLALLAAVPVVQAGPVVEAGLVEAAVLTCALLESGHALDQPPPDGCETGAEGGSTPAVLCRTVLPPPTASDAPLQEQAKSLCSLNKQISCCKDTCDETNFVACFVASVPSCTASTRTDQDCTSAPIQ
jgi:hypothetical protein